MLGSRHAAPVSREAKPARLSAAVALSFLACVAACSSTPEGLDERFDAVESAIINGGPSDTSQDAVVLIIHYDPSNREFGQCTGTMLAPRLVLTARHCVGDTDPYVACRPDGTPVAAGAVRKNHEADTLYIFTGKDRPDFARAREIVPAGQGMKILDSGSKNLCNHDIALLLLKEPIDDVPIAPIRLDSDVEVGELVTAVGWGVTEKTPEPARRQQRKNVEITAVGRSSARATVPPNEFEVGEAICSGDSGGPALAEETNAVVGVVSRGGNASSNENNQNPAASCIDGTNVYTKVYPFKDLILEGYALAEAEPWFENGPDPRKAKLKEACSSGDDCRSGLCVPDRTDGEALRCAEDCSSTETCSIEGEVCSDFEDVKVCRPPPPPEPPPASAGSCSNVPARGGFGTGASALVLCVAALAGLRRKLHR